MKSKVFVLTLSATIFLVGCSTMQKDPNIWLEDVESTQALSWVNQKNEKTLAYFNNDPNYKMIEGEALKIMSNKDRIPQARFVGKYVHNFWTDDQHPRGLLRRTTYENYKTKKPTWETLLDIDKLNATEKKSYVFKGCAMYKPDSPTCLLFLSDGGKDASEVREFNLKTKTFVQNGFALPAAKSRVSWIDENTVIVATDYGPDSMSRSGYPLWAKIWKRGTDLKNSEYIYKADPMDLQIYNYTDCGPDGCYTLIARVINFFESEYYWLQDGKNLVKIDLPNVYQVEGIFKNEFYISLMKDLNVNGKKFVKGSLLKGKMGDWKNLTEVYTPTAKSSFQSVEFTKNDMYLAVLENVNPKVYRNGELFPINQVGDTYVAAADAYSDRVLISFENPLTPPTIFEWNKNKINPIKSLPAQFDSSGFKVEQLEATSADGTIIPYFLIRSKYSRGPGPTLMTAYGGFQVPLFPRYESVMGKVWLSRGGQYVVANIRGGGEFGPTWHESALKDKRQNAFNDLFAVAEDLFKKGLTTPERLGFIGGSNGGLLAGVAYTQKPDYFKAIISNVPLLDMMRFHKLLAGHSWTAEYGDPDKSSDRSYLMKYSPYQNLKSDIKYPQLFLMTSTKDDRVHPGHARKFGARLEQMKVPFYYFENTEGGHGAAADLKQRARFVGLQYSFLLQQLQ